MKTLCFSLGLLLLTLCCCDASRASATMLVTCCTEVTTVKVPAKFVVGITKTHSTCPSKAFIVKTLRGKHICYSQTFEWAKKLYDRLHQQ